MEKQKDQFALTEKARQIVQSFPQHIKNFYYFHGIQMIGSSFPIELVEALYSKLNKQIYDASHFFQIVDNEEKQTFQVRAKENLKQNSQVFIVDHALTFRYSDLRKILKQNQKIIPRLQAMLKYTKQYKTLPNGEQDTKKQEQILQQQNELTKMELQFDQMQLQQIGHLQFPLNTITLSLMNNNITNQKQDQFIKKLQYLNLKVLWVNGNPIQQSLTLKEYIQNKTKIQIYNSKFTKNCTTWGLKYASNRSLEFADDPINQNVYKLNLDGRDIFNIDLTHLNKFKNLTSLSLKQHSITDQKSKQVFLWILTQIKSLKYLYVDLQVQRLLFQMVQTKQLSLEIANRILINKHSLLLTPAPQQLDQEIDEIQKNIFKIAGCYRLASNEQLDESSIWYVNDQMGSMIPHSDSPNIKIMPFLFAPNNKLDESVQAYSIFWPVKDIESKSQTFRDYLNGIKQQRQRSHRLAIWYQLPEKYYEEQIKNFNSKMFHLQKNSITVLQKFYANNAIQQRVYIEKISEDDSFFPAQHKVITDNPFVLQHLKSDKFKIVQSLEEATIIWLTGAAQEKEWDKYKGKYFMNQFPFQSCVVMKQNLADTVQSVFGDTKFLMRTYNLQTQLKQMIGDFYERQNKSQDNLWIIKPPNMARSMDMIITDNISNIIKSMETGPKIAQKYISQPVLREGRKVDLRYILLVRSISPLTLYLYKHFWIRSSNNPYTVDRRALSTYQTQFTVMNYNKVSDFKQIPYKSFIQDFEKSYSPVKWSTINQKIKKMLRNVFIACGQKYPQMQQDKCRAVYGIDIMVDQANMQPKLLQITFSPDCKRACQYYPTFYNQIFQTLYMDIVGENIERII